MAQSARERGVAMKAGFVAVLVVAASGALAAQWLGQPTAGIPRTPDGKPNLTAPPPRAPDGKPDLSGLWTKTSPKYARNIAADLKPEEIRPRDTRDGGASPRGSRQGRHAGALPSARPGLRHVRR